MTLRSSPDSGTFHLKFYQKMLQKNPEDKDAIAIINFYKNVQEQMKVNEQSTEWRRNNLEADLRGSHLIAEKCADKDYAQALYAALCNNDFIKNDVWPLLKNERWSCSWRYAGGIVANIREKGDYIDWYCSGNEGHVSHEIKQDLFELGWLVCDNDQKE